MGLASEFARAAGNPLQIPDPPALPPPGLVDRWVLESPWPLALACLAAGIVAWRAGWLGGRGWLAGVMGAVVAGALLLAGLLVQTPRERIAASARRLVRGVATGSPAGVGAELARDARLRAWLFAAGIDRDQILAEVGARFGSGEFRLEDWGVLELDACQDGPNVGRAHVKVRVVPAATGTPHLSWWKLDYRLEEGGVWRARGIEPFAVMGVPDPRGRD